MCSSDLRNFSSECLQGNFVFSAPLAPANCLNIQTETCYVKKVCNSNLKCFENLSNLEYKNCLSMKALFAQATSVFNIISVGTIFIMTKHHTS